MYLCGFKTKEKYKFPDCSKERAKRRARSTSQVGMVERQVVEGLAGLELKGEDCPDREKFIQTLQAHNKLPKHSRNFIIG